MLATTPAHSGFIDHFATYDDVGLDKAPGHGVSSILVLPVIVDEADLFSGASLVAAANGFYDPTGTGFTFSNYFELASLGRFRPVATVEDVVPHYASCPFSTSSSGTCTIARGDITAFIPSVVVIKEILDAADLLVNFADYDVNGAAGVPDGEIDGIIILTNIDFGGIALPFYRLCRMNVIDALCSLSGVGPGWDPTYDGVRVPWVAVAGARIGAGGVDVATYVSVHEFGHLLGFADLYDESGSSTDLPYAFMGGWSYNNQPPLPNAFSRYAIGWGNPVQIAGDTIAVLRPAHTYGDILKLGTGSQFFLVEYRVPSPPWDGNIAAAGVAITHVDLAKRPDPGPESFVTTITTCVNCTTWDPLTMLEQADGLYELQAGWNNRDDAGDLFRVGDIFPTAADHGPLGSGNQFFDSNNYDGTTTGISAEVTGLSNVATLSLAHPPVINPCADLVCPFGGTCNSGACVYPSTGGSGGAGGGAGTGGGGTGGGDTGSGGTGSGGSAGSDGGTPWRGCAALSAYGEPGGAFVWLLLLGSLWLGRHNGGKR